MRMAEIQNKITTIKTINDVSLPNFIFSSRGSESDSNFWNRLKKTFIKNNYTQKRDRKETEKMLNNVSRIANNRQIINNNDYGIANNEQEWDIVVKVENLRKSVVSASGRGKKGYRIAENSKKITFTCPSICNF